MGSQSVSVVGAMLSSGGVREYSLSPPSQSVALYTTYVVKKGRCSSHRLKKPDAFLNNLLAFDGPPESRQFIRKIRQYNCLFAFTSMGANIDRSVNDGGGPTVFKINGKVCHL